jgi:hypothetical protein
MKLPAGMSLNNRSMSLPNRSKEEKMRAVESLWEELLNRIRPDWMGLVGFGPVFPELFWEASAVYSKREEVKPGAP